MTRISRLVGAALAGILAAVIPAQAQSVVFAEVRDAVPLKFFSASTTAPDAANPNALLIGFESGRSGTDNDFSASTRAFGNRIATDTLHFNVVAPPGY